MGSLPEDTRIVIPLDGNELELVRIPAGVFTMGAGEDEIGSRDNERPAHEVRVDSFVLGIVPILQGQWEAVVGSLPPISPEFLNDELPVVNVGIDHAHEFCALLGQHLGSTFRLPSEAEWEYACRANTTTPFYWGTDISRDLVNYAGSSKGLKRSGFSRRPNTFGLYDMHGNVWEWCADHWHDDYEGAPRDGSAWTLGGDRGYHVQRGGSWTDPAVVCRSAFRVGDVGRNTDHIVGIRVCSSSI